MTIEYTQTNGHAIHEQNLESRQPDQPVANGISKSGKATSNGTSVISAVTGTDQKILMSHDHILQEDPTILNQCMHSLLGRAAERYKTNTAVISGDVSLTYDELHFRAAGFARCLVDRGVKQGDIIGVAMDRSADLVVVLIAAFKSGAVYVPIDPTLPPDRIAHILKNADPKFIVTDANGPPSLTALPCDCIRYDPTLIADGPSVEVGTRPHDLAYIVYTSGSTGIPKGVEITNGGICNLLSTFDHILEMCPTDRILAVSTIAFDMAVVDIFLPLISGGAVVVAQTGQSRDPQALLQLTARHSVTILQVTPTTCQMMLDAGWQKEQRYRHIISGGEALTRRLADQLLEYSDTVWNGYGPTETTNCASIWRVCPDEPILIGSPMTNYYLYVLDTDLKPVPVGTPGELFIGGAGMAAGYHGNEELTRSRFLPNPFHTGRMYATGDIACFSSPGKLSIVGRADNQVKIRGNRIELGDIESAIAANPFVSNTAVIKRGESLVAYCVRQTSTSSVESDDDSRVAEWTTISDHVYGKENTIAGWLNSYDRTPFSPEEMRDWLMNSVRKILSFAPQRVVEIGAEYSSRVVVQSTRNRLQGLKHVVYEHCEAHKLPVVDRLHDTVIINSVIQYFPSIDYLLSVLRWAVDAIDTGRVFLGDLRDLRFLSIFHRDIIKSRAGDDFDEVEVERRAAQAIRGDLELFISPEYFANLPILLERITSVEITLHEGQFVNEMTCFHYDVVLHVGTNISYLPTKVSDWQSSSLTSTTLDRKLSLSDNTSAIRINDIPNGRLRETYSRLTSTTDRQGSQKVWIDPSLLMALGSKHNLESALLPSQSGDIWAFDIMFWPTVTGRSPDLRLHDPEKLHTSSKIYANEYVDPKTERPKIETLLRPWLAERLPEYMIPAFFVELDSLPLTFNGKVDRKALPDPVQALPRVTNHPINDLQRAILAVWSSVLHRDQIDIHDNFFEIGGDSVRVVRVQAGLEKVLGRKVSVAKLFQYYTISMLAEGLSVENITDGPAMNGNRAEAVTAGSEDIAIVSMACRLPGGIETPGDFWTLLDNGEDAISVVPKDRWDADALYTPTPGVPGKSQCRHGGFLASSSIDSFDASFFNMNLKEARELDPSQRIMLETSWEALERAGYTKQQLNGSSTGVFIGINDIPAYHDCENAPALTDLEGYTGTGSAGSTTSGRISYMFGLEGPCLTVDTACSSSLVSTHLACTALRQGECDMAVSGGVALLLTPALHIEFTQVRGLAPDGRCRSFSDDAHGAGFAEGAAVVVLKRLSDAQRDGDLIHAVLRGTAVNHGGRTASLTTPSAAAQHRLIRTALSVSNLHAADVDYVEAHGTGTVLGDPIEAEGLARAYGGKSRGRAGPLLIGSVKSNIGHAQAAAGLVGMLKVVLALQNQSLPQTLHSARPTSAVDWHDANMVLVQEKRPWIQQNNHVRRAGISAFGIGGTNAHAIVEEAPKPIGVGSHNEQNQSIPILPLMLSGLSSQALRDQAKKLQSNMEGSNDRLLDVAFTLAVKRSHFPYRRVILAENKNDLIAKLSRISDGADSRGNGVSGGAPRLAMLFTGQGGELLNAGRKLAMQSPVFHHALKYAASCFGEILDHPLIDVMGAADNTELAALLRQTNYAQPALFTLQVALWRWWEHLGVRPDIVLGHSVGEIAAAHVAGIMSLADASRLVAIRGQLMHSISRQGMMLSVDVGGSEMTATIRELGLEAKVDIAAYNTPSQTVVSGDQDAIELLQTVFRQRGRRATALSTSRAFHSHHIDEILANFSAAAETIRYSPPTIAIVSGLTGQLAQDGELQQANYWVNQARHAVHFKQCIEVLARENIKVFVELGPQPILCGLGAACLAGEDIDSLLWCPSLDHKHDDNLVLGGSLAKLHERHVQIDWAGYFSAWHCAMVDLPTYAFQRQYLPKGWKKAQGRGSGNLPNGKLSDETKVNDDQCGLLQVDWQPVKSGATRAINGHWGVLSMDKNSGATSVLVSMLTKAKLKVTLINDIKDGDHLDGILCLWQPGTMDPTQASDTAELAVSQLRYAARRQLSQPLVWIIADTMNTGREVGQVDDNHALVTAPLWGLMRTARAENPELRLRIIGTASRMDEISLSKLPTALGLIAEPELLLNDDRILVPQLGRIAEAENPSEQRLVRTDGAVLITGGFGELGQNVARWLVSAHGVRDLVLTSRRGAETPSAQVLLADLTQLGARVDSVAGDIADTDHIRSLLARFGARRPLRGVIHAAGVPSIGMLTSLQTPACRSTFPSKVTGSWNLHQFTKDLDLDFFVLCSSLSTMLSTPGFGPYAAANAFLDALAHARRAEGLPASSVAFGAIEGGMSSTLTHAQRVYLKKTGFGFLNSYQVCEALEKAIQSRRALTVAVNLDLRCLQEYSESSGSAPALLRSLLPVSNNRLVAERESALRDTLTQTAPDSRQDSCMRVVRKVVAQALGFEEEAIDADRPFNEIGLNSFTATSMRSHLVKLTDVQLSANVFFLHPTPAALGRFILKELLLQNTSSLTVLETNSTNPSLDRKAISEGSLDYAFSFDNAKSIPQYQDQPKAVFVTGATGFVGAFLVHELLQRGVTAHCVVRGDDDRQARQRLIKTLTSYDLWKDEYEQQLIVIAGDMALYQFGLTDERFLSLADHVDSICHASGLVDWMRPFEDYVGPNIISTHETMRLANTGRYKAVHVISTIATLPIHSGRGLSDSDPEHEYATSKWISERLVGAARWRGAKASVYRLPFVTAAFSGGQFRLDRRDFLHNLIAGSIDMGIFPRIDADLSLVLPVDYLCRSVVTVMMQEPDRIGQDFDFVNDHAIPFDTYFDLLATESDSHIQLVPFSTWRQQALSYAMIDSDSALARISPVLDGCNDQNFAALFSVLPPGQHVLGGKDHPAPTPDHDSISNYRRRIDVHKSMERVDHGAP